MDTLRPPKRVGTRFPHRGLELPEPDVSLPAELLSAIYEAPATPRSWPDALRRVTAWLGGSAGCLEARRLGPPVETRTLAVGVNPSTQALCREAFAKQESKFARMAQLPPWCPQLFSSAVSARDLMRSGLHHKLSASRDLLDLAGMVLLQNARWTITLKLLAHTKHFELITGERLAAIAPHLTRALSLGFAFDGLVQAEPTLHAVAKTRAVGLVFVDAKCKLVEPHEATDLGTWLESGDYGLSVAEQTLCARTPHDQHKLKTAVNLALAGSASSVSFGSAGNALCAAFAQGPRRFPFLEERCVSVVFTRTEGVLEVDPFDELPTSLRNVAQALSRGLADKDIARELALPVSTVRTYVTRCFTRLRVRSRRELIVLAASASRKSSAR